MAYASAYYDVSYRPFRRGVRTHRATPTRRKPEGTTQDPPPAPDPKRRLLCDEKWLSLAVATARDFPPWRSVYHWFRAWRIDGRWERLNSALRERLRAKLGRNPQPSAAIVDSQSVKSTGVGGTERGFDPAKQIAGRKRHLLVDTEGLVLNVRVHSAKVPDEDGIRLLLEPARGRFARLSHLYGSMPVSKGGGGGGPRRS